jgi:uncharacterized membrane protein
VQLSGAASYIGDNIYNTTGFNQTGAATTAAGTTKTFVVNVQNDGAVTDSYRLKGAASSTGFTVKYFSGTTDITSAVVGGTYTLNNIPAGGAQSVQLQVTAASTAATGSAKSGLVTATSTHSGTSVDAIKTVVTVG